MLEVKWLDIDATKTLKPEEAPPGLYCSDQGEILIRTHWGENEAIKSSQWINFEGTFGFTPKLVHPARIVAG